MFVRIVIGLLTHAMLCLCLCLLRRIQAVHTATASAKAKAATSIGKWGQRQRELASEEGGGMVIMAAAQTKKRPRSQGEPARAAKKRATARTTPASGVNAIVPTPAATVGSKSAAQAAKAKAAAAPPAPAQAAKAKAKTTTKAPICLVCRRKFKTVEVLRLHCEKSEMHKRNLAAAAKKKAQEALAAPAYRDRASERRKLYVTGTEHGGCLVAWLLGWSVGG